MPEYPGRTAGTEGEVNVEEGQDFRLKADSAPRGRGCDLSRNPWYLLEMALGRDGRKRTTGDIGAY